MYCASRRHCSNKIRTARGGPKLLVLNELFNGKKKCVRELKKCVFFLFLPSRFDIIVMW